MSKELEMLKQMHIKSEILEPIETALKEYEGAKNHIKALNEERVENSLKLKALEIIKEKCLYVDEKYGSINFRNFNVLTQEEYELLKEVLL